MISLQGLEVDSIGAGIWAKHNLKEPVQYFKDEVDFFAFLLGDSDGEKFITTEDRRIDDMLGLDRGSEVSSRDCPMDERAEMAWELYYHYNATTTNRKIFKTALGRMGFGPIGLEEGDRIVVLFGSRVPFVMGDRGYGDVVVGHCYVRGIMQGEAVRKMEAQGREPEIFDIH